MNYLITGGCGFIGSNLVNKIFKEDKEAQVVIIDNLVKGVYGYAHPKAWLYQLDVSKKPDVVFNSLEMSRIPGKIDIVVHLAAHAGVLPSMEDPRYDFENNVLATFNLLKSAVDNNVKRFVFSSTGGAIAAKAMPPINEETKPSPISPYGCSKLCCESYCKTFYEAYDLETVILRFSNVYGPYGWHKQGNLVPTVIKAAINDEEFSIFGDGDQTRDFVFVGDLVNAIWLAMNKENIGGEVFQLATNIEGSVNKVVGILDDLSEEYLGRRIRIKHGPAMKGEVRSNYCQIDKAKRILGYQPQYTLEQGLRKTFEWFLDYAKKE